MNRDGKAAIVLGVVVVLALLTLGAWHWFGSETTTPEDTPREVKLPPFDLYDVGSGYTRINLTVNMTGERAKEAYEMKIVGKDRMLSALITQPSRPKAEGTPLRQDWIEAINAAVQKALDGKAETKTGIAVTANWEPWLKDEKHRERKVVSFHVDPTSTAGKALDAVCDAYDLPEYTVQKGDTLSGIALKKLGTASRWREILDANPGLTEKSLRVGQTIRLPRR